jgi:nucleotide-binding universal stress UspA family protein
MAQRCGLPLAVVLPLASNAEYEAVAPQQAARADAEAAAHLQALAQAAQAVGVALQPRVRRGPEQHHEIVEEARALGTQLLVARQRGRRGLLARLLVGEMVSRVAAQAPCSVLLVPRDAAMWSRGVLVGLDPLAPAPAQAPLVQAAVAVAAACALPLHGVCVWPAGSTAAGAAGVLDMAAQQARQAGVAWHPRAVPAARAGEALLAAADTTGCDLLVLGRLGSTARQALGAGRWPVWLVNPPTP